MRVLRRPVHSAWLMENRAARSTRVAARRSDSPQIRPSFSSQVGALSPSMVVSVSHTRRGGDCSSPAVVPSTTALLVTVRRTRTKTPSSHRLAAPSMRRKPESTRTTHWFFRTGCVGAIPVAAWSRSAGAEPVQLPWSTGRVPCYTVNSDSGQALLREANRTAPRPDAACCGRTTNTHALARGAHMRV